jgi:VanZ family protein
MSIVGPAAEPAPPALGYAAPLARLALLIVLLLVAYASLYPFTDWMDVGVPAFAYLKAPWPRYWVGSEIAANVAAYFPAGALFVWAVYPYCRGALAVLLAVLLCGGVSGGLEALQTFLPDRISSNVDLAANAAGALLGALVGVATARRLIGRSALLKWRLRWFLPDAGPALILAALWVIVQVPRQPMLFGTGEFWLLLGDWAAFPAELVAEFWAPEPVHRVWAEQICTAVAMVGAAMLLLHSARPVAARGVLPVALVVLALAIKVLLQPLAIPGLDPAIWLTEGAVVGGCVGVAFAVLLSYVPNGVQRGLGIAALVMQLAIVNLFPADQYFGMSTVFRAGWLHLESLTLGLSVIWPVAALVWLTRPRRAPIVAAPTP